MTVDGQELGARGEHRHLRLSEDGQDAPDAVSNADIAMYRAKEQGRNRFCFYTPT
jgi:GGDEF domain-containing protein